MALVDVLSDWVPPNAGDHNVFTQWRHTGDMCPPSVSFAVDTTTRPARLKMGVRGGRLNMSTCEPTDHRVWKFAALRRNHWYNFTFHVKWSSSHWIGFVQLSVNGRMVIGKTHTATLYQGMRVYVKQGFYRNPSQRTTVIYHDGLHRFRP